jgi:hypothetical protein
VKTIARELGLPSHSYVRRWLKAYAEKGTEGLKDQTWRSVASEQKTGERVPYASDFLPLDGRLCNASTRNCTSIKSFSDPTFGSIAFTKKPGTYYVDIIDMEPDYRYEDYVSALVY